MYHMNGIQTRHIQGFLNSKTDNCSLATLNQHNAQFQKLEKYVNAKYRCDILYHCDVVLVSGKSTGVPIKGAIMPDTFYG